MHDMPRKKLFDRDYRFLSRGRARMEDVHDLAAWLLNVTGAAWGPWDSEKLKSETETGRTSKIALARLARTAWVYMTGWAPPDGATEFRSDIYGLDKEARPPSARKTLMARRMASCRPSRAGGAGRIFSATRPANVVDTGRAAPFADAGTAAESRSARFGGSSPTSDREDRQRGRKRQSVAGTQPRTHGGGIFGPLLRAMGIKFRTCSRDIHSVHGSPTNSMLFIFSSSPFRKLILDEPQSQIARREDMEKRLLQSWHCASPATLCISKTAPSAGVPSVARSKQKASNSIATPASAPISNVTCLMRLSPAASHANSIALCAMDNSCIECFA